MCPDPFAQQVAAARQVAGSVIEALAQKQDPLWLSALRGRLLAVVASGLALWGSIGPAWREAQALMADGPTGAHVGAILAHVTALTDHGANLLVAGSSLVALLAALGSKWRSARRTRQLAALARITEP